jgi:hypothetical protein
MSEGSETDPDRRASPNCSAAATKSTPRSRACVSGDVPLLDDTALKDRFPAVPAESPANCSPIFARSSTISASSIAACANASPCGKGRKGELLEEIMGERDAIADSDQGRSFRAFWDFLMSSRRQEELTALLERVLALPPVASCGPITRTRRVHYDWLEAGEHTQRTVAQLSQQLRRFLDDQAWLENRRIMDILHGIEAKALALRDAPPAGDVMDIADTARRHRTADGAPAAHARRASRSHRQM